ncbi:pitrilysin family protein [Sphingomonas daechungensis]|uniref:M16 family metallopeptidase n=1 Tax=Sphingomonas daechungensis TaxID=1176646 RepID=UPI0031ECE699
MNSFNVSAATVALAVALSPVTASAHSAASQTVSVRPLIEKAPLQYERFTLVNGLRVLVHTDRKAPVVALSVYYDVGSKHEPKGKTGFAHLFEHLMFNGSENADGDWFEPMAQIGATALNGSTWFDRTNYFETVPVGALERALYLESDRMGHLLGAVTPDKLSNQIGVVQNEKRQGDNKPFGLVSYKQTELLFAPGHPYGHSTIGSMADLSAASLQDVKQWFKDHYGPNNAVLVLAGDIDAATARPLVQKYFGDIARGPATTTIAAPVPTLSKRLKVVLKDHVPVTRLYRTWVVPGLNDKDSVPLSMGAAVLGGLASSRLDNALVRDEQLAVRVTASLESYAEVGQFEVTVDVKPGADPDAVGRRLDAIIDEYISRGPTAAELERVVVGNVLDTVNGLQTVGGKAATLAEGELYSRDPNHFARDMRAMAAATPAGVRTALAKWLKRPVLALSVVPGEREPYVEASAPVIRKAADPSAPEKIVKRGALPPVTGLSELAFPSVSRITLSNGIGVFYARRTNVPLTQMALSIDAGFAADPKAKLGLAALTTAMLKEGTTSLSSRDIAQRQEQLGASIGIGSNADRTTASLGTLSSSIVPALALFADVIERPAFAPREFERMRAQQLARIASEGSDPGAMAARVLAPALYGQGSLYGFPATGSGTAETVKSLTRDDLVQFHSQWLRPDKAKLFIVSDMPLSTLTPLLEQTLGTWQPVGMSGIKPPVSAVTATSRILLVDRKGSPQSQIIGAQLLAVDPKAEILSLDVASDVVGGSFLSRINMDLRETRGWSYGVRAGIGRREHAVVYQVSAPVQADRTGESLAALLSDYRDFLGAKGATAAELERTVNDNVKSLPGSFETTASVLGALQSNDFYARPDDYYEQLPAKYHALTAAAVNQAARQAINPEKFLWVVVGDAAKLKPQLDLIGLPVELVPAG